PGSFASDISRRVGKAKRAHACFHRDSVIMKISPRGHGAARLCPPYELPPLLTRRSILLAGLTASAAARTARAQGSAASWPSGPIRIVVPFAAGGSIDMIARL